MSPYDPSTILLIPKVQIPIYQSHPSISHQDHLSYPHPTRTKISPMSMVPCSPSWTRSRRIQPYALARLSNTFITFPSPPFQHLGFDDVRSHYHMATMAKVLLFTDHGDPALPRPKAICRRYQLIVGITKYIPRAFTMSKAKSIKFKSRSSLADARSGSARSQLSDLLHRYSTQDVQFELGEYRKSQRKWKNWRNGRMW